MTDLIVSKGVGIDLGTTNSAVAVMNQTDEDIVIHSDPTTKSLTTPSCVWKDPKSGELVVGRKAFRRIGNTPEPIRSIKRLMGHPTTVRVTDEDMSPEQVSAAILAEMKQQIEQNLAGWNNSSTSWVVDRAIVTVPAYFDHPAIEATRKAAEAAGLDVLDLLHEPTAAACYHCWRTKTTDGTFLVYDLGGGTFDVSVVRYTEGSYDVLGISGNPRLGGDDIDIAVAQFLQEELVRDGYALEPSPETEQEDRINFNKLRFIVEGVKKALSTHTEFMLSDAVTLRDKNNEPVIIERMWERAEFEDIIRSIVERTIPYCDDAMKLANERAGITLADVDAIILAGGSTHIPLVREMVTQELCASDNPSAVRPARAKCAEPVYDRVDTIVALGAAIRASEAGGLATYDSKRSIRVSFRGIGASYETTTRVGGKVEALDREIDLTGGEVRLEAGAYEDETELRQGGSFAFNNVPLQPGAETTLTFHVYDADGKLVATTGRQVAQTAEQRPKGPSLSNPQLVKGLKMEVDIDGEPDIITLVPEMASLPFSADFQFRHPGGAEKVLLPLYQRRRKIQVIEVDIPSTTAPGAAVKLNVQVDDRAMITVKGTIGDTQFDALVVQPPDRKPPALEEFESLERRFAEAVEFLAAGERALAQTKWAKAKESYDAAGARGDDGQLVHEFEELEAIVAEIAKGRRTLHPPKADFDRLVGECREINDYAREIAAHVGKPHDAQEMGKSIDAYADQGESAFRDSDQRHYREAIQGLDALREHLLGFIRPFLQQVDDRPPGEKAASMVTAVQRELTQVRREADMAGRADAVPELQSLQRELDDLAAKAHQTPEPVRQSAGRIHARLEQLHNSFPGAKPGTGDPDLVGVLVQYYGERSKA
ncbi:MAG TPA: Hsp70 family protein [Pseudonocardiaceae bacterium]|nr:Hsp70 family protein [Pseudonocardiaceae bacterium]